MRDNMSNKYTTAEHFFYMLNPLAYDDNGSLFVKFVGEELVPPTYEDRYIFEMNEKCQPVAILFAKRLVDPATGVNETFKIANVISNKLTEGKLLTPVEASNKVYNSVETLSYNRAPAEMSSMDLTSFSKAFAVQK